MILLDTCTLLWLSTDLSELSKIARSRVNDPNSIYVSAISAFEIGQKVSRKSLILPKPIDEWFAEILEDRDFKPLPVTMAIAAQATLLPPIHRDPFDRMIIATAMQHDLTLLTPDPFIRKYPRLKTCW